MRYKTAAGLGVGAMVVVIAINVGVIALIGWVAWHFISKFW